MSLLAPDEDQGSNINIISRAGNSWARVIG